MVGITSLLQSNHVEPAQAGIDLADIDFSRVGAWQRVPTSDKPHKRNGAVCVFNSYPIEFWFKNHATEVSGVYKEAPMVATPPPPKVNPEIAYAKAAELALSNWNMAEPVERHAYLKERQVRSYGLRLLGQKLIVPAYDADHHMWTYQTIDDDGQKFFLKGGRKQGCYFPIGGRPKHWVLIAEGYATAASLHESLGLPVAVAFDCGNLQPVAEALARRFPRCNQVLAADNDAETIGNPGITKARAVQKAVSQVVDVLYPEFSVHGLTDWNDAFQAAGGELIKEIFHDRGVGL